MIEHDTLDNELETARSGLLQSAGSYTTSPARQTPEGHLEAAVASAVLHPNVVQTYDYQLVGSADGDDQDILQVRSAAYSWAMPPMCDEWFAA